MKNVMTIRMTWPPVCHLAMYLSWLKYNNETFLTDALPFRVIEVKFKLSCSAESLF